MKKLSLSKKQVPFLPSKRMSMDDYYQFVLSGLRLGFGRLAYRRAKRITAVNVRFVLK